MPIQFAQARSSGRGAPMAGGQIRHAAEPPVASKEDRQTGGNRWNLADMSSHIPATKSDENLIRIHFLLNLEKFS